MLRDDGKSPFFWCFERISPDPPVFLHRQKTDPLVLVSTLNNLSKKMKYDEDVLDNFCPSSHYLIIGPRTFLRLVEKNGR